MLCLDNIGNSKIHFVYTDSFEFFNLIPNELSDDFSVLIHTIKGLETPLDSFLCIFHN